MLLVRACRFVLFALLVLCTTAWTAAQGGGSPPADPAIAFVEIGGNSMKLSVMNADGARKTAILTTPGWLIDPCWSPNGASICFGLQIAGGAGLYAIDVQVVSGSVVASNLRMLAAGSFSLSSWSPDGTTIAFSNPSWPGIWSIPALGGTPTQLYAGPHNVNWLSWSPDGTRIAFSSGNSPSGELRILDTILGTDSLVCSINGGTVQVDWGRTGNQIVFHSYPAAGKGQFVHLVNATVGAIPQLVASGSWFPTFSPDDTKIAYTTGSNDSIVIRNLSTGTTSSTGARGRFANWRRY